MQNGSNSLVYDKLTAAGFWSFVPTVSSAHLIAVKLMFQARECQVAMLIQ